MDSADVGVYVCNNNNQNKEAVSLRRNWGNTEGT